MVEVEMKFPVVDWERLEQLLRDWKAEAREPLIEADHYFNAPDRDFAATDEALRLRCIGSSNFVTYKGPKRDAQTKTRSEIEMPLGEGDDNAVKCIELLTHLGYRPVREVRKRRRIFQLRREGFATEVCLDDVEGLGRFAEVEILTEEDQVDQAREVLLRTASELGLQHSERRSYLQLLLEQPGSSNDAE